MKKITLTVLFAITTVIAFAQQSVTGKVTDTDGNGIPGVNVVEKGTSNGVATDFDGNYSLTVNDNATIVYSFVGYADKEEAVNGRSTINVTLNDSQTLEEVVLVGSRTAPRSNANSPLPVDVLPATELTSTGQPTFDKALQYRIPSFNTVQTPVNDATSLLDPYEIRNMGPSRTLILINGKRKNLSAVIIHANISRTW